MLTKYDSECFRCHKKVPAGEGDIQRINSKKMYKLMGRWGWVVRCFGCKGKGNEVLEVLNEVKK